jgi:glc operon protein GlcG
MKTLNASFIKLSLSVLLVACASVVPVALAQAPSAPSAPVAAAPAPLPGYGTSINLEQAKKMMAAAEAHARANNWIVGIAIVDTAAQLVMFQKADGLQHASVAIAQGKAVTAVNFRRPTKALEDGIAAGGVGLRILGVPGTTPLEGGIPIVVDGRIIGGIGVSGVASSNDALIALAGIAALAK